MPLYQFHFVGLTGNRPMLDFCECVHDDAAAIEALQLLKRHGSALAVEIWHEERLVIRIERNASHVIARSTATAKTPTRPASPGEKLPPHPTNCGSPSCSSRVQLERLDRG